MTFCQHKKRDAHIRQHEFAQETTLQDDVHHLIVNYLPSDEPLSLLSNGLQKDTFQFLYEFIQNRVIEEKKDSINELKNLLRKLFEFYAAGTGCTILEPELGSATTDDCIIKFSSKKSGNISELLLFGYRSKDGKIIQKPLVRID